MAINSNQASIGISGIVLLALLSAPAVEARTEATATPVPFSQAPASLPAEAEMQALLVNLQGFMGQVDKYIQEVQIATEDYRAYVKQVKQMLAGCEVESDVSSFENTLFAELVTEGRRQCQGWVANFDQQAWAYAARLDEAVAFQKLVQRVGGRVQGQIDRIRIAMYSKRLKRSVDQGLRELEKTRKNFKPWMSSKGKKR